MLKKAMVVGVLALMASGCYLDMVVRDIEMHRDSLERDNANLRSENARLRHQVEIPRATSSVDDELAAMKRKFEALGLKVDIDGVTLVVTMLDRILFESGKAALRTDAKGVLRRVAGLLQRDFPDRVIRVEGHTDDRPIKRSKFASNWELSSARALAVLHFLRKEGGIPEGNMYAAAYAYTRPATQGTSEAARAQNRRVQIVILPMLPVTYTTASRY